jgi:[acyl-carrier-protein] S-malonyltransferase
VVLAQAAGSPSPFFERVGGFPFVSDEPAAEAKWRGLAAAKIQSPAVPVVANVDARPMGDPVHSGKTDVPDRPRGVVGRHAPKRLIGAGVERFIEVGPGRVLSGLVRRTDKTRKFSNIEDKKSADAVFAVPARADPS